MSKNILIKIEGNSAYISGDYDSDVVHECTSYLQSGYKFSPAYKAGYWDGRVKLFNKKNQSFPAGLASIVVKSLKENYPTYTIKVLDHRDSFLDPTEVPDVELAGVSFGKGKYSYQMEAVRALIKHKRGVLKAATGAGKTRIYAALIKALDLPTLIIVPGVELLYQLQEVIASSLGIDKNKIGLIGDQNFILGDKVTIGIPDSLLSKYENDELSLVYKTWKMVIIDEAHHGGSDTYYDFVSKLPATYRFGGSGTPLDRSDGADLKLIAQTGDILYDISNKKLIDIGVSVKPHIEMVRITSPILGKGTWAQIEKQGITDNQELHNLVVDKVNNFVKQGKNCVVFIEKINHGKSLNDLLPEARFISGSESSEYRKETLELFKEGKLKVIITSRILNEGVDLPNIQTMVFAGGGKAKISLLQRIGRGIRSHPSKDKVDIVDFFFCTHKYLKEHSQIRLNTYNQENCFLITMKNKGE